MYASVAHLVDRAGQAARRALAGGVVGGVTALLVTALTPGTGDAESGARVVGIRGDDDESLGSACGADFVRGEQTDRALDEARVRLAKRLEVDAAPYSTSPRTQPLHLELPSVPAERSAFPWLLRRLNLGIHEADRTGESGGRR